MNTKFTQAQEDQLLLANDLRLRIMNVWKIVDCSLFVFQEKDSLLIRYGFTITDSDMNRWGQTIDYLKDGEAGRFIAFLDEQYDPTGEKGEKMNKFINQQLQ